MSFEQRESYVFYRSFYSAMEDLSDDEQLIIYRAITSYALEGKEPEMSGYPRAIFRLIKPQLDASRKKYENGKKGAKFGKKGGRPSKIKANENPNKTPDKPLNNPNETPNVNDNDNVNDINNQRLLCDNKLSPESDSFQKDSEVITEEKVSKPDYDRVIALYHEYCKSFPRVFKLSDTRKTKIRIRFEEMKNDYSMLETLFKKMGESKFLQGDNKTGWKASFDWIFENDKNWVKVIEGNYERNQESVFTAANNRKASGQTTNDSKMSDLDALYRNSLTVNK